MVDLEAFESFFDVLQLSIRRLTPHLRFRGSSEIRFTA